jgi:hypothetical protein
MTSVGQNNLNFEPKLPVNSVTNKGKSEPVTNPAVLTTSEPTEIPGEYYQTAADIKNKKSEGNSEANVELEIAETQQLSAIKSTDSQPVQQLNSYIYLMLQASMLPDGNEKDSLIAKAKSILKDYNEQKNLNPEMANELEQIEQKIFKTDESGKVLTGEIDSSKKLIEFFNLGGQDKTISATHKLMDAAVKIAEKIALLEKQPDSLDKNLELQKLQIEKSLTLVQARINIDALNGNKEPDKELTGLRTELRQGLTKVQLSSQLNKLQNGADPAEIIRNIKSVGQNWYVKEDKELLTQYNFALGQAQKKAGNFQEAANSYEQIKKNNPEQALNAQISIIGAAKDTGLFSKGLELEGKIETIKLKEKRVGELKEKLAGKIHNTFTRDETLKKEEAELNNLGKELQELGPVENIRKELSEVKVKQQNILNEFDKIADAKIKELSKKSFEMEKAGKIKSPEYQELRNELQSVYEKKYLVKAGVYEKQGNNQAAIKEYQELLKKPGTEPELKNEMLMKVAVNYSVMKNYDSALKAVHEAADIAVKSGNNTLLAKNMLIAGSVFMAKGEEDDLKNANEMYAKAVSSLANDNSPEADFLKSGAKLESAKIYYAQENFSEGDKLTNEVATGNKALKNSALFIQGNAYLQDNQPTKAFSAFDKILQEAPQSMEAQSIKKELENFTVDGRLDATKVNTKSDTWAAAQVALKVSGSNSMVTSLSLAAGGAVAGAAIGAGLGVWIGGVGAVPGAMAGLAVGTAIDRGSALIANWNKVEQTYKTGYENISTFENTINLAGLALDMVDIIPVAGAFGKAGATAMKQTLKAGAKEVSKDVLDEVLTATGKSSMSKMEKELSAKMLGAREFTRTFMEDVDKFGKVFTDSKFAGAQLAVGGAMLVTPGTLEVVNAYKEFNENKIDGAELNKRLLKAGENTVKAAGSVIVMGMLLGKVQNMGSKLDNITKGMSKELSGPAALEKKAVHLTPVKPVHIKSTSPEEIKVHIKEILTEMRNQKFSAYSFESNQKTLLELEKAFESGKYTIVENKELVVFSQVKNKDGKISIEFNPNKLDKDFTDRSYIAHELIHIIQPMKDMPDLMREGFTEYTARKLFPRENAPALNYDKLVNATDALMEGLLKRGAQREVLGKLLGEKWKNTTLKDIESNPQLKEELKVRLAQMMMEWKPDVFRDRLSSWFGLEVEELPKYFDKLVAKYGN